MAWLCQCGEGSLMGAHPAVCPVCGMDLAGYFQQQVALAEDQLQQLVWRIERDGSGVSWAPVRDAQKWLDGDEELRATTHAEDWIEWIVDRFKREGVALP